MLYELIEEKTERNRPVRTYRNTKTGTETKLSLIYEHPEAGKWWGFQDLYKIPIMRLTMAKNITDLFTIGMTLQDIKTWINQEKALIRSSDPEKYEKLYALILEKERLATFTADPIKQQLALCTVYVLEDKERIDYFDESMSEEKLKLWKNHQDLVAFFLTWHTDHIQRYLKSLQKISTTVSNLQAQVQKAQEQLKP